ncbi:MAG: hypothetical protein K2X24_04030, partial [Methylobacterium sp.]|nr:hypothetical protein [Methylobacterium sp.]
LGEGGLGEADLGRLDAGRSGFLALEGDDGQAAPTEAEQEGGTEDARGPARPRGGTNPEAVAPDGLGFTLAPTHYT